MVTYSKDTFQKNIKGPLLINWQLVNHYKRRMFKHNLSLLTQTTSQNRAKLLEMVTYALKIVPWNKRVNKSNFEKWLYGGF